VLNNFRVAGSICDSIQFISNGIRDSRIRSIQWHFAGVCVPLDSHKLLCTTNFGQTFRLVAIRGMLFMHITENFSLYTCLKLIY